MYDLRGKSFWELENTQLWLGTEKLFSKHMLTDVRFIYYVLVIFFVAFRDSIWEIRSSWD